MSFQSTLNENNQITTQSFDINFQLSNDGGQNYINSTQPEYFDNWSLSIDQLEGEINVPYQFENKIDEESQQVTRRITVPNSILGGFAQFKINYIFTQFPSNEPGNEGVFLSGNLNTERIFVPAYIPPVITEEEILELVIDERYIREAFADQIYTSFFQNLELPNDVDVDFNSLQSTIRDGQIVTGRQEGEQLVFFKKDRNTPENKKDFTEGKLNEIITDISSSVALTPNPQDFNIEEFLVDKFTVVVNEPDETTVVDDPSVYELEPQEQPYLLKKIFYRLKYTHNTTIIDIDFAELHYVVSETNMNNWLYHEFQNVINISQITLPTLQSSKINATRAREVLDTNIFELLPNQRTRQNQIDEFFQEFGSLIGTTPPFNDVDNDGVAEELLDNQQGQRISTSPDNRNAFITRTNEEANPQNVNKTLESMRDTLNTYLTDVDNRIEEISDDRPEYENKSEGFLKIRKPNQSIIIRNPGGSELEFQKIVTKPNGQTGPSFLVDGFTITMWVRFTSKVGRGTLFNFGHPYKVDEANRYGFRLETLTRKDTINDNDEYRRMVRLVVYDNIEEKLYDSHVAVFNRNRTNTVTTKKVHYGSQQDVQDGIALTDSLQGFRDSHTNAQIPTDDLNEWFFICATYNPSVNEEIAFTEGYEPMITNTGYWLNHFLYEPSEAETNDYVQYASGIIENGNQIRTSSTSIANASRFNNLSNGSDLIIYATEGEGESVLFESVISDIIFQEGGPGGLPSYLITLNSTENQDGQQLSNGDSIEYGQIVNFPAEEASSSIVSNSGLGARCKVEIISKSDLLRARGFKVNGD